MVGALYCVYYHCGCTEGARVCTLCVHCLCGCSVSLYVCIVRVYVGCALCSVSVVAGADLCLPGQRDGR